MHIAAEARKHTTNIAYCVIDWLHKTWFCYVGAVCGFKYNLKIIILSIAWLLVLTLKMLHHFHFKPYLFEARSEPPCAPVG